VGAELCSLQTKPNRFRIAGKKGSFSGTRVVPEAMTPTACVSGVLFLVLYLTAPSRGQRFAGEPSFQPAASERKELKKTYGGIAETFVAENSKLFRKFSGIWGKCF
jgi:hypothetical protein